MANQSSVRADVFAAMFLTALLPAASAGNFRSAALNGPSENLVVVPSSQPITDDSLRNRAEVPPRFSPNLSNVESEALRRSLRAVFEELFWRDEKATPAQLYVLVNDALKTANVSAAERAPLLAASVDNGFLKFEERREAIKTLVSLYPEQLRDWASSRLSHDSSIAEGVMMHALMDSQYTEGPPKVYVSYGNIGSDPTETKLKVQRAQLGVTVHKDRDGGTDQSFAELGDFELRPTLTGHYQMMTVPFPKELLSDEPSILELSLVVSPMPIDRAEQDRSSTVLSRHYKISPYSLPSGKTGYSATPLGPNKEELVSPAVVEVVSDIWQKAVLYSGNAKEALEASPLLGTRLPPLVGFTDRDNQTATAVQTVGAGRWYVVVGASWCGPCKVIAPQVEEFNQLVSGRVLRVSVDSEPTGISKALDPANPHRYQAVLDSATADLLNARGLPFILVVDDGRITRAESLTPTLLEQLRKDEVRKAADDQPKQKVTLSGQAGRQ